jgi:disulfide oxidoreductase YuzD
VAAEIERRFGDSVRIQYLDATQEDVKAENTAMIEKIEQQGLLYPVTVVDGTPLYDGAVSYPAIMRAVQNKLDAVEA